MILSSPKYTETVIRTRQFPRSRLC